MYFMYLFISLFICLFFYLFIHLFIFLQLSLSVQFFCEQLPILLEQLCPMKVHQYTN